MKPRHFWWLVASEAEKKGGPREVSSSDKKAILDALKGNPKGDFW